MPTVKKVQEKSQKQRLKAARRKMAKQGGCTANESVYLNNLRLDATMENRVRLEVWKDKVKDQAALGRMEDDLVFIFSAMAGNLIESDEQLEGDRRSLMETAPMME